LLTFTQTKRTAKLDFVLQIVFLDQTVKGFYNLARAFNVARTTNANGDFHKMDFSCLLFYAIVRKYSL
jgi:hypothetical protein